MAITYWIKEYGSFKRGNETSVKGYVSLPVNIFDRLEQFILENKSSNKESSEPLELLSISVRKGVGKIISAKNYVGMITMKDGTVIEILPKIYSTSSTTEIKKVFLNMLSTFKEFPFKTFNIANLDIDRVNIFEFFIKMFVNEVYTLVKRGLKASYVEISENKQYVKGHINFSEHIRKNTAHKERTFCDYDSFSTNRPENKLVKSTLLFLYKKSSSSANKRDIRQLLLAFDGIDDSKNHENDFASFITGRNIKEYDRVLKWCKVFLMNKSFTAFKGSEISFALLFPMEKLFESYVASKLRVAARNIFTVKTQDRRYHLFNSPKRFLLRPDIVLINNVSNETIIMDTKWKILSADVPNFGISQLDMYQMFAYQKKYHAKKVIVLYPMNANVENIQKNIIYTSYDGIHIAVQFIDLLNIDDSIQCILAN